MNGVVSDLVSIADDEEDFSAINVDASNSQLLNDIEDSNDYRNRGRTGVARAPAMKGKKKKA